MKLGVVREVAAEGQRVVLEVLVDDVIYRDVVLVQPLHAAQRVTAGDRVAIGRIDGNDTLLLAWPLAFASQTEDVIVQRSDGLAITIRDSTVEIAGSGRGVAREQDTVQVTIPAGAIVIDPNTFTNPAPVVADGQITSASAKVVTE